MTDPRTRPQRRRPGEWWHLSGALLALAAVTAAYGAWLGLRNPTVVGLSYLLIVLLVASASSLRVAVATSVASVFALNFFFLPPVRTLILEDPENWIALLVFLVVSYVGSRLSVTARERARLMEERQVAERMRERAELKSALLSSLGHDLKTPLTAIAVAADNLRSAWADDGQRQEQLGIIGSEVARLNRLFQDIVDMARIETGAVAPAPEWVRPADIVDAAVEQARQALASHPLDQRIECEDEVLVDPRLAAAALAHVLENAGAYAPSGTPITISATRDGPALTLAVRDRGPGIPPDDRDGVFDRFYRGVGAGRGSFRTGMGLAITRGLMVAQGGRVGAANHPEGGAVFTLTVPVDVRAGEHQDSEDA